MTTAIVELIQIVSEKLTEKDVIRLNQKASDLIQKNMQLGNPSDGFLFHGQFVSELPRSQQSRATKKLLHKDLHDEGRAYFEELKLLENEQKRIRFGMQVLLKKARGLQDIRDMLPDVLMFHLPTEISTLPRTRPEGFQFQDDITKMHDYDKTVEILNFYTANHLLY